MTTRRKWLLGSLVCMLVVLLIAGYQFETQYEMGQIVLPWQKTRRRVRTAHAMLSAGGSRFVQFRINDDPDEREARGRRNRAMCAKLTAAWTEYFVRCVDAKDSERAGVRAEMEQLVTHTVPTIVTVCNEAEAENEGPPDEQIDACIAFFTSGTCVLDYGPDELAVSTLDLMVRKPTRPQPHMEACPFLFGL